MPLPHFFKMFLNYMLATQALTQDTWMFCDNIFCVSLLERWLENVKASFC
jgi:hypothetical protein